MHWKAINVTLHPSRSLQQSPANPHFITCHHIPHIAFTNNNRPVRHFIHLTWSYRPAAVLTRQAHSLARPPSNTLKTTVQRPAQSLSLTLRKRRRKKTPVQPDFFFFRSHCMYHVVVTHNNVAWLANPPPPSAHRATHQQQPCPTQPTFNRWRIYVNFLRHSGSGFLTGGLVRL